MADRRMPSYPRIDGQLDVFDVLELVDEEGLVPTRSEDERRATDKSVEETLREHVEESNCGLVVVRGEGYSFWVHNEHGERMHPAPFWSQVECWAFIIGWCGAERRRRH